MEIEQHQEYDDAGETMGAIDGLLNNDNDGDEMGNNNNNDDDNGASGATVSRELESSDKREIGNEAVWTLSTAKPGNGVDQLRDDNIDTFWQSDGPQPHLINIQFHKKMRIKEIALYTDYKLDESYTPSKISIRSGTGFHDIQEIQLVNIEEPEGWITVPLAANSQHNSEEKVLRAHLVQIAILSSHQNGRDTHLRQVKVYGSRPAATKGLNTELSEFSTIDFHQFATIR